MDFVYLDADHSYNSIKADIDAWGPKVGKGGIVSGHDYYNDHKNLMGVVKAVDEYVQDYGFELKITEWDMENPARDERQPSWYVIKK